MRPKAVPLLRQSSGKTQKRRMISTEVEASRGLETETERPLDAEDVALSLLEARVRAEEARADRSVTEPYGGVSVRLPRTMILQLQAEAADRHITPSELIRRALMEYLPTKKAGRRLSASQAGRS